MAPYRPERPPPGQILAHGPALARPDCTESTPASCVQPRHLSAIRVIARSAADEYDKLAQKSSFSKHLLRAEASILNVGTEPGRLVHATAFQKGNLSAWAYVAA